MINSTSGADVSRFVKVKTGSAAGFECTAGGSCTDADADGYNDAACGGTDCDDTNPNIKPGAAEICGDGIDQDCSEVDLPCSSGPHAGLNYQEYPGNCLTCHVIEANDMLQTTHYRWRGDAPDMLNSPGTQQGKLTNAVNSYCINILGDWPLCGSCHAGRGKRPDDPTAGVENIDCLVCHSEEYAVQRSRQPDGSMGVANPTDGMAQNVQRPTRANCLKCHATAGTQLQKSMIMWPGLPARLVTSPLMPKWPPKPIGIGAPIMTARWPTASPVPAIRIQKKWQI